VMESEVPRTRVRQLYRAAGATPTLSSSAGGCTARASRSIRTTVRMSAESPLGGDAALWDKPAVAPCGEGSAVLLARQQRVGERVRG